MSLAATIGCNEDTAPMVRIGSLAAPDSVDFGTVQLGWVGTATLAVTNTGEIPLRVLNIRALTPMRTDAYAFSVPEDAFTVPAGRTVSLPVTFTPRVTTRAPEGYSATVVLSTEVYDAKPPHSRRDLQVVLLGRPVPPGLEVSPNPVDFGRVFVGGEKSMTISVRNVADVPIGVFGETTDGAVRWRPSDTSRFDVGVQLDDNGRWLDGLLPPGAAVDLEATYRPAADGQVDRAGWYLRNCSDPACRLLVTFQGEGTSDLLICEPPSVDFGRVNPGRNASREIVCANPLSDPVTLADADLVGPAVFGLEVAGGLPQAVAAGGTVVLRVDYAPTREGLGRTDQGLVRLRAVDPSGGPTEPIGVPVSGQAGGPFVVVEPNPLDFGLVAIGVPLTRLLVISNDGFEPLIVNALELTGTDPEAFGLDRGGLTLPPGESRALPVVFDPQREGDLAATLWVRSNDEQQPEVVVELLGRAERVTPCRYSMAPESIEYGAVFVGTQPVRTVEFRNLGTDACILNGIEIQSEDPDTPFSLLEPPRQGVRIGPGDRYVLRVRYRPTEAGRDRALLVVQVSDPAEPVAGVPLGGIAEPAIDLGCPPPQVTPAGTPVQLMAGTTEGRRYEWRLVSTPTGGNNSPDLWAPDPPVGRSVRFLPFIVGVYVIELTVTTEEGQALSCQTEVTAQGQGLRVTLTWNGTGDVDLHLHNGQPGSTWFDRPQDCHYSNTTPQWVDGQPAGTGPNPELDFDNRSANGLENTSIDVPEVGRTYHIGVHNFTRAEGRVATVEIFCGGTSVPDATFRSRPLRGNEQGDCSSGNDFWRVATVRFDNSGQCIIRQTDVYSTARRACVQL